MTFSQLSQNARMCLVGAVVFVVFGLLDLPWAIQSRARAMAMTSWPVAEAEIVTTDIASSHRKNEGVRYHHEYSYRYTVDGGDYTAYRTSFGGPGPEWRSEADAERAVPPVGSKIKIHYNPRDPGDAVVYVAVIPQSDSLLLDCIAGGLGLAGGVLMVVGGLAWRKEIKSARASSFLSEDDALKTSTGEPPSHISSGTRTWNVVFSGALLFYGVFGGMIEDLLIPDKISRSIHFLHFHGTAATLMNAAVWCSCANLASIGLGFLHDDASEFRLYRKISFIAMWCCFSLALALHVFM